MTFEPRKGDKRPDIQDPPRNLIFGLTGDKPFRWLPRHGKPVYIGEWILQKIIKTIAWLPVYIALIVTLVLLLQIYGLAFLP